nr:hypothetical protein [Enterovirga sp. DB1703]
MARRKVFVELAVYGGGAVMLQFDWRRSTEDVDAVVREGFDENLLAPSLGVVAAQMELDPDWLNNAVGMFTPALFTASNSYPVGRRPGLRVFLAKPHYLLAMKLQALANVNRGNRDVGDARQLASHLGLSDEEELARLYRSIYDEDPPVDAQARFGSVFGR